jgi:hypothetical protein
VRTDLRGRNFLKASNGMWQILWIDLSSFLFYYLFEMAWKKRATNGISILCDDLWHF